MRSLPSFTEGMIPRYTQARAVSQVTPLRSAQAAMGSTSCWGPTRLAGGSSSSSMLIPSLFVPMHSLCISRVLNDGSESECKY
ncbi:hypothetical protein D3C84_942300 [compost metagenome]